jgi:hypothetical protein
VDDAGKIVREVRVASEPEALLQVLANNTYRFKRIGLEAGPLSQWLFPTASSRSKPSGRGLARSNQEPDDRKNGPPCLTQKAPYKGLGAESEEKREPVSDIDTGVVGSLKVLDPAGRLEKPT